jgi:hypothetical protein
LDEVEVDRFIRVPFVNVDPADHLLDDPALFVRGHLGPPGV